MADTPGPDDSGPDGDLGRPGRDAVRDDPASGDTTSEGDGAVVLPPAVPAAGGDVWSRLAAFIGQKAPTTRATYAGVVTEWCSFVGAEPGTPDGAARLAAATELEASAYRIWLDDRPGQRPRVFSSGPVRKPRGARDGTQETHANATIAKKLTVLRRVYRMLGAAGLASPKNPFDVDSVPSPAASSGRKRPTEMVPFDAVEALLAGPDSSTRKGLRDKALLAVLFGGGLRRSEAAGLRLGDVRRTRRGTAFVRLRATKGRRDADQALPAWAAGVLDELVVSRRSEGASPGDFLFVSYRGPAGAVPTREAISHDGVYRLFKKYARAGGLVHVSPHSARATAITRLLDKGVSFHKVREFSRHSSVQMVEIYDKRRVSVDENPGGDLDYESDE